MARLLLPNLEILELIGNDGCQHVADETMASTMTRLVQDQASCPWLLLTVVECLQAPHAIALPLMTLPSVVEAIVEHENWSDDPCHLESRRWSKRLSKVRARKIRVLYDMMQYTDDEAQETARRLAVNVRGPSIIRLGYDDDIDKPRPATHLEIEEDPKSGILPWMEFDSSDSFDQILERKGLVIPANCKHHHW